MREKLCGKFLALDGPDGCGKSTQLEMLKEWIEGHGVEVHSFRDPGTTIIGEKIRDILLSPEHKQMCTRTELLLYMAARAQLWHEQIGPALEDEKCVILDRWISSTCAYQGCAGGFGIENVIAVGKSCLERLWPDITIILDVDLATSAKRMDRQLDRMEMKGKAYHQKVRNGFLELAKMNDSIAVIDATEDINSVHQNIIQIVQERF